jgi:hypothetical protein
MSHHIISCHIISCHIISSHITPYDVTSYHVTSQRMMSCTNHGAIPYHGNVKCSNNKMRSNCVKRNHPLILPLSYFTSLSLSLSLTSVPPFIPLSLLLNVRHILPASFLFSSIHHIVPDLVSLPLPMFLFR